MNDFVAFEGKFGEQQLWLQMIVSDRVLQETDELRKELIGLQARNGDNLESPGLAGKKVGVSHLQPGRDKNETYFNNYNPIKTTRL